MLIEWKATGVDLIHLRKGDTLRLRTPVGPISIEVDDEGKMSVSCQSQKQAGHLMDAMFFPANKSVVNMEQVRWNCFEKTAREQLGEQVIQEQVVEKMIQLADDDQAWSFNSGDLSLADYDALWAKLMNQVGTKKQGEMP